MSPPPSCPSKPRNSRRQIVGRNAACRNAVLRSTACLLALWSLTLAACGKQVGSTRTQVSGTKAERVAAVERLLRKSAGQKGVPGQIVDAQLLEIQTGDNRLGPADYQTYLWMQVQPADIPLWEDVLTRRESAIAPLTSPAAAPPTWWKLKLDPGETGFRPKPLLGRANGWIVLREDGQIYAYTFSQ